jgi:vacuolar-type H+-ATPase subunit E/Vma4
MSLEDIKEEIKTKAKKEAAAILQKVDKENEILLQDAKEKAAALRKEQEEMLKNELALIEKKAKASSELMMKKAILTEKKILVEEVINEAKDKLVSLPKDERKKLLNKIIERAGKEIEVGTIYCSKNDQEIITGNTKPGKLAGGIIAETPDGSISVDYSFETLLEEYKEKNIEKISEMLFK